MTTAAASPRSAPRTLQRPPVTRSSIAEAALRILDRASDESSLTMRALGAEVRAVTSGSATLKDAVNDAMRDWVTNVQTTHYVLGSAMGPHPYPTIVRDLQRAIGDEAARQVVDVEGRLPDLALACVGGLCCSVTACVAVVNVLP